MKLTLSTDQLDAVAKKTIEALQKENAKLTRQIKTLEGKIQRLENGMDLTKEKRERIQRLAEDLGSELNWAGWHTYDDDRE